MNGTPRLNDVKDLHEAVCAWFLGPRAENFDVLQQLFEGVLHDHNETRKMFRPEDGVFISQGVRSSEVYKKHIDRLRAEVKNLSGLLNERSIPFYSPRYAGHMSMEMSMPSIVGWLVTILFNPNNVAFEASPFTTQLEIDVGQDLCAMLGFKENKDSDIKPWGHLACDGTVANIESMWAARNLKFYPFALREAMLGDGPLSFIANKFIVETRKNDPSSLQLFTDLDTWRLLNLSMSTTLGIADRLCSEYGITTEFLAEALSPYLVQTAGKENILKTYDINLPPLYFVPSTRHYSWPKSAALVGIGSVNCKGIAVDAHARMDIPALRAQLQQCLDTQQAVYAVVAVIGTTEEGAVDPLDDILALRDEFEAQGLSFIVHADAAWGGYFASMIPKKDPASGRRRDYVPSIALCDGTIKQLEALARADSITIDPHKAGYIPYPAGGLCYRDGRMRFLLTWTAPYVDQGNESNSIGVYGVEGSKPGAPAVACYLHHAVVGLDQNGHGGLLGEVSFTSRRMSALWAAISSDRTSFVVVPFNPFRDGEGEQEVAAKKQFIRDRILGKSNDEISKDKDAFKLLRDLGSDLNINAFACNFRIDGHVNDDVEEANYLNQRVFKRLSATEVDDWKRFDKIPLFLSATTFGSADYGECLRNFLRRLGLETESKQDLFVLRNVVMSPFQTTGGFLDTIEIEFRKVVEEEVKHVVERNTVTPQIHEFVMQGIEELYLVYRPLFHHTNSRQQLIIRAKLSDSDAWEQYQRIRRQNPSRIFVLKTATEVLLSDILEQSASINVHIGERDSKAVLLRANLYDATVVKSRSLLSRWRDHDYPASYTPFYLYGSLNEQHIEHALLRAPNAQISSDCVTLNVHPPLSASDLDVGVWARVALPERAVQPFSDTNIRLNFQNNRELDIVIVQDPSKPTAHGPGLATGGRELARGTLKLGSAVFYDCNCPNTMEFAAKAPIGLTHFTSTTAGPATRSAWEKDLRSRLHDGRNEPHHSHSTHGSMWRY